MSDIIACRVGRFEVITLADGHGKGLNALFPAYEETRAHAAAAPGRRAL